MVKRLSVTGKLFMLWGTSLVLAVIVIGGVFVYSLDSYYQKTRDQEIRSAKVLVADYFKNQTKRMSAIAAGVAGRNGIQATMNLLGKYQDTANYEPLIYDVEKKKLLNQIRQLTDVSNNYHIAIYDAKLRLSSFYVHKGADGLIVRSGGIVSYENGQPFLLVATDSADSRVSMSFLDEGLRKTQPRTIIRSTQQRTLTGAEGLSFVTHEPIIRSRPSGKTEFLGVVEIITIADTAVIANLSKQTGNNIGYRIEMDNAEVVVGSHPNISKTIPQNLPTLSDQSGYLPVSKGAVFSGLVEVPTDDSNRVILSINTSGTGFLVGLDAFRNSVFFGLAFLVIIVAPVGVYAINRVVRRPVASLMTGVAAVSGGDFDHKITLERKDELGVLAQSFNSMAKTVREREAALLSVQQGLETQVKERTKNLTKEIAERIKTENELLSAIGLNKAIISSSPVGITVFDEKGDCITSNDAAAKMAGAPMDDYCQINYTKLETWKEMGLYEAAIRALEEDTTVRHNVRGVSSFGKEIYLDCYLSPFVSRETKNLLLITNDLSSIRKAHDAMELAQRALDRSPDGVLIIGRDYRYRVVNKFHSFLHGIPQEEILNKMVPEVLGEDVFKNGIKEKLDQAFFGEDIEFEGWIDYAGAGRRYILTRYTPLMGEDGEIDALMAVLHDQTQAKEMQGQLIQSSKMATLGEMATGVAHELNQPLNVIRMAANNILRKAAKGTADPDYLKEKLDRISAQTERAASIIDHMRIFGRRSSESMAVIDARDAVSGTLNLIGQQMRGAGITVLTELPDCAAPVLAHQVQLEQVLLNLTSNARHAMEKKGRGEKKISLSVGLDSETVTIAVCDTGGGIPTDVLNHIFDPFYTTKEVGEGTGLGLSISYGIVKEMGGTIHAENESDGAAFTMTFPRQVMTEKKTKRSPMGPAAKRA